MKKIRALFIILLVTLIAVMSFAGCASDNKAEETDREAVTSEAVEAKEADEADVVSEEAADEAKDDGVQTESKQKQETVKEEVPADTKKPQKTEEASAPVSEPVIEEKHELSCTVYISCATILDNMDMLDPEKAELVPSDGVILSKTTVAFEEGESVFDVLLKVTRANKIHMESSNTPAYDSVYIEGIGNLYEFDCGSLSGWTYKVNGEFPNFGCSKYILSDGDEIAILYTCDLGKDVGCYTGN